MSWRDRAACLDAPQEWFFTSFPERPTPNILRGIEVCQTCPVTTDCLDWAVTTNQTAGVWGGLLTDQRRRIRRRRLGVNKGGREPRELHTDLKVLRALQANADRTVSELAGLLGLSGRTVQRSLKALAGEWPLYARDVYRGRVYFLAGPGGVRVDAQRVAS